jgi:hypothetical protein
MESSRIRSCTQTTSIGYLWKRSSLINASRNLKVIPDEIIDARFFYEVFRDNASESGACALFSPCIDEALIITSGESAETHLNNAQRT